MIHQDDSVEKTVAPAESSNEGLEATNVFTPEPESVEPAANQQTDQTVVVEELSESLKAAETALKHLKLKSLAEQANLEKRHVQRLEQTRQFALERIMKRLLPVLDSLDTAIDQLDTATVSSGINEGIRLTQRLLVEQLTQEGLEVINEVGVSLNPQLHHVMQLVPCKDKPAQEILAILQKGYQLHGRLLRPALVSVTSPDTAETA